MVLTKSEKKDRSLYIGAFTGNVKMINPTKEELSAALGYTLEADAKDLDYNSKDKDNNDVITISFWLQAETTEKQWFNARFRLTDKEATNKDSSKYQYVNATGGSGYYDSEKNMLEWFNHFQAETEKGSKVYKNTADKITRKAIQGEAGLYIFLRAWLARVNFFDINTNILIDIKKAFRNIDKYVADEYKPLLTLTGDDILTGSVCCLATVHTGDKDGVLTHYQNLYNEYLPGYQMKKLSTAINTGNWEDKAIKKWKDQATGEYGIKDSYALCMLKPFVEGEHLQATNETLHVDSTTEIDNTDY